MEKSKIGLQLYSVRDDMAADMAGTLKKVKEIGYDYVEFAGYFGKTASEVRSLLDDADLQCISVHQTYDVFLKDAKKEASFIKTLGAKFVAIPWMDAKDHAGSENFGSRVKEITSVGKFLKSEGLQLLYHNHDFELEKNEGEYKLDILYKSISSEYLKTEIDTCWVKYAGVDPAQYLLKYSGRSPILHLKDFEAKNYSGAAYALIGADGKEQKKDKAANGFKFKPLGSGVQDFKSIIAASEKAGCQYLIVEQDESPEMPPIEAAALSRKYLKTLGL